jgi:signal transduction histidine kinase
VVGGRRIRRKLWIVLALPLAVVTAMATLWGLVLARDYTTTAAVGDRIELALAADELVLALQLERGSSDALLRGDRAFRPLLNTERVRVDAARSRLAGLIDRAAEADRQALREAVDSLSELEALRTDADKPPTDRGTVLSGYAKLAALVRDATAGITGGLDDEQVMQGLDAMRALGAAAEATAVEGGQLAGLVVEGGFGGAEYAGFVEQRAARLAAIAEFERQATPAQAAGFEALRDSDAAATVEGAERMALRGPEALPQRGVATSWWNSANSLAEDLRAAQQDVGRAAQGRSEILQDEALRQLGALAAFVVLAVAAGVGSVLSVARALRRPLARLADEADEIARRRLPGAVARLQNGPAEEPGEEPELPSAAAAVARGGAEVGRVARAIDNLQRTALSLASEQVALRRRAAESLANLGRRNQNLVRRQLRLISDLERDESDPNVLANLFELDHLATRMRRNAESLLVLTDEESPRRWASPMPVADVIRSAIAEVEDYRRVVLRRTDDLLIVGAAVAGLAHLLAELIENALSFSPPDQDVEIYARSDGGGCLIAVVDHGLGMSPAEFATANERLAGAERPLVAPTRFLGHHVVGRLAERLRVQVHLHESPLTGITAKITIPAALVAPPSAAGGKPAGPAEAADGRSVPAPAPIPAIPAIPAIREIREIAQEGRAIAEEPALVPLPTELSARAQRLLRRSHPPRREAEQETEQSAPALAPAGAPTPQDAAATTATTRNGLVKRVPRRSHEKAAHEKEAREKEAREKEAQRRPAVPPASESADEPVGATPEQVGSRLSSLRAAMRRATAVAPERPAEPATEAAERAQPGDRSSDDEGVA